MKEKTHLEDGECICNMCEGEGNIINSKYDISYIDQVCPKCNGKGKVDWVSRAINKPYTTLADIAKDLAEELRTTIDNEILKTIIGKTKKEDKDSDY